MMIGIVNLLCSQWRKYIVNELQDHMKKKNYRNCPVIITLFQK